MSSFKRLLNVIALFGAGAFAYALFGLAGATLDYRAEVIAREAACSALKKEDGYRAAARKEGDSDVEGSFDSDQGLCEREPNDLPLAYVGDDLTVAGFLLSLVFVINYVFFGRLTLWHKNTVQTVGS